MTNNIISASRRTDVPAFYGDWFKQALDKGSIEYEHPRGGSAKVSLDKNSVFAFWSKDYTPFLGVLHQMRDDGCRSVFNYTINNLPVFETYVNHPPAVTGSLKVIARLYSPEHITWRYDPIILSSATPASWHIDNFRLLCRQLDGFTQRCFFNFPVFYGKVLTNLKAFTAKTRIAFYNPDNAAKQQLVQQLAGIASEHNITLCSCAEGRGFDVPAGSCIDGGLIQRLYGANNTIKPSRKDCKCAASIDIGTYNTCKHGCIYCYANTSSNTIKQVLGDAPKKVVEQ